ncbi:hypothetical protein NTE_00919 [Candidatus Nitrososphaera evergladensis SR1]|uniref:Uncharacterized protein n=1 Tax=Candidatus Nitrososphaera evergladensis SR1 TaxID=1459636 RepID=A0A075MPC3_9ARCH|nr:hypothetical protein NTE_00919 [Candidatus Nitrososphaera evergladensis SR1]
MVDFSTFAFPIMYVAIAGLGITLAYVVAGSKIRQLLHKTPVQSTK